ncbi:hypothetical protein KJZ71_04780 [Patescibacteria group bacterium]|uniref:Uncharacterized protein n=1 Tax=candidate division WWE3 bacterium TaxID=2053526 RepID=A0A928Y695_UNCKA|nr:hypothetical protein [candidate division WWE3 bacterium]MCL4733083.1 hypothetical protein [Patescibacteria group bacterium]MDL1953450.1 hypothetical protein [Candidatus Uhrbacteria bacterium UHB]RIL00500.1 MAG: hypothetical protein DCC77_02970 [Candidatus Uhrbacteria bacterium]
MTSYAHTPAAGTPEPARHSGDRTLTIRLPKLSALPLQTTVLLLLILLAGIQTAELFAIRNAAGRTIAAPAASAGSPAPSSGSGLPSMVGGC